MSFLRHRKLVYMAETSNLLLESDRWDNHTKTCEKKEKKHTVNKAKICLFSMNNKST